ncbi:hypothetical protein CC80DRAFT_475507 [Byssothecium circinans]|uniref:Uncharacterized protein n=1 Tax=Byssothecium circinans TaxID=147558 RepID=A0A6A5TT14_9PLEO|nr:hypothetical protein CC80DRAFT_475507 [Byssothecium circinans]
MARLLLALAVASFVGSNVHAAETHVQTPSLDLVEKRQDPPIPTVTFRPLDKYLVERVRQHKLQMYPRGIYDDFPKDGVTLVFGPDLKKRIIDTMGSDCQANQEACRNRLIPILDNTDIHTHAKRVILISAFLAFELIWATAYIITAAAAVGAAWLASESPAVKYEYSDLDQLHQLGGTDKVGVVMENDPDAPPATIVIPGTPVKPPTSTGPNFITLETLKADTGNHKAGDIVYHIPVDSARKIQDLLGMLGIDRLVESCKGYDLLSPQRNQKKRANTLEQCWKDLSDMTSNFLETAPEGALQLAPQNFPAQPAPGGAIGYPVQNVVIEQVHLIIVPYHILRAHMRARGAPAAPPPTVPLPQFHVPTLVRSALGMTILSHAAMFAGQVALDIFVSKDAVSTELKEDEFTCPNEILCIDGDCGAQQQDETFVADRNAFCKKTKNKGCRCTPIYFPDHTEVESAYMDEQYKWLEELIKLADSPEQKFEPKCEGELQESKELSGKWKDKIKEMCGKHKDLRAGTNIRGPNGDMYWHDGYNGDEDPVTWSFHFKTNPADKRTTCSFSCEDIFNTFADSKDCNKGNGLLKTGEIETDCGSALYAAYKR